VLRRGWAQFLYPLLPDDLFLVAYWKQQPIVSIKKQLPGGADRLTLVGGGFASASGVFRKAKISSSVFTRGFSPPPPRIGDLEGEAETVPPWKWLVSFGRGASFGPIINNDQKTPDSYVIFCGTCSAIKGFSGLLINRL